ncbi:organic cation transporter protein-like isoform X1 [Clavelina lepadiformis]|uniref:organic cation transporter protein-like isoform X1 n=1 Tax=Clavelina lepadiformis TaxID=159417 RepID=UPI0040435E1E
MVQFEVILEALGQIGPVQILICVLWSYFNLIAGFNSLATVFIAYTPDVRCNVPPLDNSTVYPNLTEVDILNFTTPYDSASDEYNGCYRYNYDLNTCDGTLSCVNQSASTVKCDNGYHYDRSIFTETVVTEFNLICGDKYLNTVATSMYYVGFLIGSIVFGNFADAFGRKLCSLLTCVGFLGCMFGLAFSRSVALYIVLRTAIAAFGYGTTIGTFVYIMEIVGMKWRTFFGMFYQTFFALGYMIMGGIAYNWRDWHEITFVSTLLSLPFLLIALIIPESPRWLFIKKKDKQGIKVSKLLARINKVELTDEIWERAKEAEKQISTDTSNATSVKYTSLDLFKTKATTLVTLNVMFNWLVNSLVYYGVSLNAGALAGDLFVNNTLNGVMEIASYIICIIFMDRIGRRILLCASLLVAGLGLLASVIVNVYADDNESLITLGVVFSFIGKVGISGSFAIIYNFTSELFPTVLRSNAVGVGSFAARIGGIVAPYIISLQDYVSWLPNTIFGVFGIAAGILSLFLPETNGVPMMETPEEAEEFYKNWKKHKQVSELDLSGYENSTCEEMSTKI